MGVLSAADRNAMPQKEFALPGGRYPINDPSHARNALSRVSQNGSPDEKAKVRAKVKAKYPSIGQGGDGQDGDSPAVAGLKKAAYGK